MQLIIDILAAVRTFVVAKAQARLASGAAEDLADGVEESSHLGVVRHPAHPSQSDASVAALPRSGKSQRSSARTRVRETKMPRETSAKPPAFVSRM